MAPRLTFFTGKGGVGKSTIAALQAVAEAGLGKRVLLVSLDPAHNLGDIFQKNLGDEPKECAEGLRVYEPDIRQWSERYLRDIEEQLRASYRYLTALNIDRYFKVLRHSPGLDEYAMSLIFRTLLQEHAGVDHVIFDMPPTGLSMRFFAAPSISAVWTHELLALRRSILERKEMITTVTLGRRSFETDKVLQRLEQESERYARQEACFRDEGTSIHIVINPDKLSWHEAQRIIGELRDLRFQPRRIFLNKSTATLPPDLPTELTPAVILPRIDRDLIGLDALNEYLNLHGAALGRL